MGARHFNVHIRRFWAMIPESEKHEMRNKTITRCIVGVSVVLYAHKMPSFSLDPQLRESLVSSKWYVNDQLFWRTYALELPLTKDTLKARLEEECILIPDAHPADVFSEMTTSLQTKIIKVLGEPCGHGASKSTCRDLLNYMVTRFQTPVREMRESIFPGVDLDINWKLVKKNCKASAKL